MLQASQLDVPMPGRLAYVMTNDLFLLCRGCLTVLLLGATAFPASAQSTAAGTGTAAPPTVKVETPATSGTPDKNAKEVEESGSRYLKGRFLIGATWGPSWTVDENLGNVQKLSPFIRWNSKGSGWGPAFGLSWMSSELRATVGGQSTPIGTLKLRPLMVGVGYSKQTARARITAGIAAGYTFNDAAIDTSLPPGVTATMEVTDTWAVGPRAGITFAVTRRLGLVGSVGYVYSNPDVTVRVSRDGQQVFEATDHVRADVFSVRVGLAVSLF